MKCKDWTRTCQLWRSCLHLLTVVQCRTVLPDCVSGKGEAVTLLGLHRGRAEDYLCAGGGGGGVGEVMY